MTRPDTATLTDRLRDLADIQDARHVVVQQLNATRRLAASIDRQGLFPWLTVHADALDDVVDLLVSLGRRAAEDVDDIIVQVYGDSGGIPLS